MSTYEVSNRGETADVADMQPVSVASLEQTLLQERSHTVRDHTITLHLSETETTVSATTLDGLTREDLYRSTRTRVDLVVYHVL